MAPLRPARDALRAAVRMGRTTKRRRRRSPNLGMQPTALRAAAETGGRPRGSDLMQIRRAEPADEEALASIRRRAIFALAVPAMSREQAERWATRAAPDRVARAMLEHDVWVAVEGAAIGWVEVDRYRVAALYGSPSCSRRGVGSVLLGAWPLRKDLAAVTPNQGMGPTR